MLGSTVPHFATIPRMATSVSMSEWMSSLGYVVQVYVMLVTTYVVLFMKLNQFYL